MGKFAKYYQSGGKNGINRRVSAFTLVEMLAVAGIMILMLGLTLPAINDVLGSKGRKGAVNILLNTFEQARVAALEQSTNVYVGFANDAMPDSAAGKRNEGFAYTRFIVFREYNADLDPASPNPPAYVALTKWLALPKGISFKSGSGTILSNPSKVISAGDRFPSITQNYTMPVLEFANTGIIQKPASNLNLYIYEGFYSGGAAGTDVFTRARGNSLFERISFSRFTGRAQLDITSAS